MRTYSRDFREEPSFIPKMWDTVSVNIGSLSNSDIPVVVCGMQGSLRKGKLTVTCRSGVKHQPLLLIWKKGTASWTCWLSGKRYLNANIRRS